MRGLQAGFLWRVLHLLLRHYRPDKMFVMGRFEPALAQRAYQWQRPQWRDLLSDLANALEYSGHPIAEGADDPIEDYDGYEAADADSGETEATADLPKPKRILTPARPENCNHSIDTAAGYF
jgi:hypothetical protein